MIRRTGWLALGFAAGCASGSTAGGAAPAAKPNVDPVAPPPVVSNVKLQPEAVAHYALSRVDSLTVTMSGSDQGQVLDRILYLTVTTEPSTTGRQVTILVDSQQVREAGLVSPIVLDSLRGMRWTGMIGADGRVGRFTASRPTLIGAGLDGQFRLLFPALPKGGIGAGASWTDSTSDTVQVSAFGGHDTARLDYKAGEGERAIGEPVLPVSLRRLSLITGSTMQSGQVITIAGNDSTEIRYRISTSGRLISAEGSSNSALTITIPAVGQTLPASKRAFFSLTRIP
ncbi:MAG TPA: hypothetical protein VJN95_06570 [Gemmatimonadales bacterium]|nr:hypothetical protein [Gemmatimonadales bacterium]